MNKNIEKIIKENARIKENLLEGEIENIEKCARIIIKSLKSGGKLLIFGNGGSAADSQHIAAELVGRFKKERKALPAIALTANTSILTAVANDYGYDVVFARQIEALGKAGDVAFGISTSGNSKNVIDALKKAKSLGLLTVGMTGRGGGKMKPECGVCIAVDSSDTPRIQESHIMIAHVICELVEDAFCKG